MAGRNFDSVKHQGLEDNGAKLIAHISEEAGELSQACGKLLRFGALVRDPAKPDSENNIEAVLREASDVFASVDRLVELLPGDYQEVFSEHYSHAYFKFKEIYGEIEEAKNG